MPINYATSVCPACEAGTHGEVDASLYIEVFRCACPCHEKSASKVPKTLDMIDRNVILLDRSKDLEKRNENGYPESQ